MQHQSNSLLMEEAERHTWDIEALLARGSSANVYLAHPCRRGTDCIDESECKVILKVLKTTTDEPKASSMLQNEVSVMAALQTHPNIVGFYGLTRIESSIDDLGARLAMKLEYCNGGDLHHHTSRERFEETEARPVMQGILNGLSYMHTCGYIHRDIKPENVLWTDGNVKIADFGVSCHTSNEEQIQRRCGSAGYVAPEILLEQKYGPNSDCFSAGALLYFIISGRRAFSGATPIEVLAKSVKCPLNFRKSVRLERLSADCKNFVVDLTWKNPLYRPTSTNALRNPWLCQGEFVQAGSQSTASGFSDRVHLVQVVAHDVADDAISNIHPIGYVTAGEPTTKGPSNCPNTGNLVIAHPLVETGRAMEMDSSYGPAMEMRESSVSVSTNAAENDSTVVATVDLLLPFEPKKPDGGPFKRLLPSCLGARRAFASSRTNMVQPCARQNFDVLD